MSGEDERSRQGTANGGMRPVPKDSPRPAAGSNPFLAEAPVAPAPVRRRGGKPPPGIISAGGVDMARAHASNIRPAADTELPQMETAKVVVSVETNPRRVQTMRNLEALRPQADGAATADSASPWAHGPPESVDKAALPSSNLPRERDTLVPPGKRKEKQAAFWIRVTAVAMFLLLIAGVTKRMGMWSQRSASVPPPAPHIGGPLIPEPLPDDTAATAPSPSGAPTAGGTAQVGGPSPDDTGDVDFDPVPRPVRPRPAPRPTPPPTATAASTGTLKPLFELPNSK